MKIRKITGKTQSEKHNYTVIQTIGSKNGLRPSQLDKPLKSDNPVPII